MAAHCPTLATGELSDSIAHSMDDERGATPWVRCYSVMNWSTVTYTEAGCRSSTCSTSASYSSRARWSTLLSPLHVTYFRCSNYGQGMHDMSSRHLAKPLGCRSSRGGWTGVQASISTKLSGGIRYVCADVRCSRTHVETRGTSSLTPYAGLITFRRLLFRLQVSFLPSCRVHLRCFVL